MTSGSLLRIAQDRVAQAGPITQADLIAQETLIGQGVSNRTKHCPVAQGVMSFTCWALEAQDTNAQAHTDRTSESLC